MTEDKILKWRSELLKNSKHAHELVDKIDKQLKSKSFKRSVDKVCKLHSKIGRGKE